MKMCCLLKFFIICGIISFGTAVVLDIEGYGRIQGSTGTSFYAKRPYYAFHGLRYAKAPIGDLRFLPPEPIGELDQNDTDVWDATSNGPQCPQGDLYYTLDLPSVGSKSGYKGEEDCLLLNVFTPKLPTNESHPNLPVLFFIHGGAFASGGAPLYTAFKFMDEDVVLVVIQYRLGPLGFLSFQTEEIPGNAGLFDQIEALRWVNSHIYEFGGDPERVTIFGQSAGSASVTLLMLSPHAEGLFSGTIAESGSAVADFAIDKDPVNHAQVVTEKAGCFVLGNYTETLQCLRNVPANVLTEAYNAYSIEDKLNGGLGFGGSAPVVQTTGKQRFIEKDPVEILEKGEYNTKIPAIFGATRDEGSIVVGLSYVSFLEPRDLLNDSYFLQYDYVRSYIGSLGVKDPTTLLSDTLTEKYLKDEDTTNFTSMIPGLTDLGGVLFMKAPTYRNAELHSMHGSKVYWYSFDFQGRCSNFRYMFLGNEPPVPHGVAHSDELQYLFTLPCKFNATEIELSKRMLKIWTNFATYGDPTPEGEDWLGVPKWEPLIFPRSLYMSINREFKIRENYESTYNVAAEGSRAGLEHLSSEQQTMNYWKFRDPIVLN